MTNEETAWQELSEIPADPPEARDKCSQCKLVQKYHQVMFE